MARSKKKKKTACARKLSKCMKSAWRTSKGRRPKGKKLCGCMKAYWTCRKC